MSKDSSADEPNVSRMIFRVAIVSRLSVLVLIVFWRYLLSPYDTSASLNPSCLLDSTNQSSVESVLWPRVRVAVEDSIVWDSVYFVRIAQCGYEYEQTYAFLPLLPVCINVLSQTVFAPLVPLIGYRAVLGLSGYILNNVAFLFAAHYFHRLSIIILKDTKAALHASFLFCFNPASIFYSSIYSESLYALFSLGGIYHLLSSSNNIAMLLFALSGSARSNGVLNAGYFCFRAMHQAYDAIFQRKNIILAVEVLIVGAMKWSLGAKKDCLFCMIIYKAIIEDHTIRRRKQKSKEETRDSFGNLIPSGNGAYVTVKTGCTSILVLPFILHLGFMAATAFFVMHVQVATRFLSANPPLYWFASQLMVSPGISKRWGYLIWAYSAAYILLGSLLFSNFYPFT
uniref:GPI mannosyltransferase 2 n=1 Tax=Nelumbo nucifera TaxID=4432 RepID=A0A822YM57_NELNU|nr:TPA_asm: hypothetical protein HUJ06_012541 [Nelumbo nucifera]